MKNYSKKPPEKNGAGRIPDDNMQIKDMRHEIEHVLAAINKIPDVREARIKEIKLLVEAGMYFIDPRRIAEKILSEIV